MNSARCSPVILFILPLIQEALIEFEAIRLDIVGLDKLVTTKYSANMTRKLKILKF